MTEETITLLGGPQDGRTLAWRGGDTIEFPGRFREWAPLEPITDYLPSPSFDLDLSVYRRSRQTPSLFIHQRKNLGSDRRFEVGDIVTRDGTDLQRVIEADDGFGCITVECVRAPTSGWCHCGETESNLAARYVFAGDVAEEWAL